MIKNNTFFIEVFSLGVFPVVQLSIAELMLPTARAPSNNVAEEKKN